MELNVKLNKETLISSLKRALDPLTRKVWYISCFKFHRWFTPKLFYHCLINFHQLGTLINQDQNQQPFMIQHFCATCYPNILSAMNEAVRKQNEQAQAQTKA